MIGETWFDLIVTIIVLWMTVYWSNPIGMMGLAKAMEMEVTPHNTTVENTTGNVGGFIFSMIMLGLPAYTAICVMTDPFNRFVILLSIGTSMGTTLARGLFLSDVYIHLKKWIDGGYYTKYDNAIYIGYLKTCCTLWSINVISLVILIIIYIII